MLRISRLLLAILLSGGMLCRAVPVFAQAGESGGIGGTGISGGGGGEEAGGIGGTGVQGGEETGGIGGTGIGRRTVPVVGFGPIQRFGSVFVNGREYGIGSQTLVTVDGQPAPVAALQVGDMALVRGIATASHAGIARQIAVWQSIIGPIGAVEPDRKSFTVLGQRVRLAGAVTSLRPGAVVGVSGQRQADGTWIASRVTTLPASARFRLETTVAGVGQNSVTFQGLTLRAAPSLLAGIAAGERVVAIGLISGGTPRLTALSPHPVELGAPGTLVEARNYFQSVGGGRLVAADGMVAIGAIGTERLSGFDPTDVVGRISPTGSIEITHLQIELPEAPAGIEPRSEPSHADVPGTPAAEHGGFEPSEEPGHAGDADEPASVEPPELGEPPETEIEPPEIQVPEPQAPEPDIDAPEVEPPSDR